MRSALIRLAASALALLAAPLLHAQSATFSCAGINGPSLLLPAYAFDYNIAFEPTLRYNIASLALAVDLRYTPQLSDLQGMQTVFSSCTLSGVSGLNLTVTGVSVNSLSATDYAAGMSGAVSYAEPTFSFGSSTISSGATSKVKPATGEAQTRMNAEGRARLDAKLKQQ